MELKDALCALPAANAPVTLDLIEKLTQNVARNPTDEKFRRIKLSNPKIGAAITNVPGAVDALKLLGWVEAPDGLALPESVRFDLGMEVVTIIEAKEHFARGSAECVTGGSAEAAIRNMETDQTASEASAGATGQASSGASAGPAGDSFEYIDRDGETVRLVKYLSASPPHIDVLVEGALFWKGIPSYSPSTYLLACGQKGASSVPEAYQEQLKKFLNSMPAAAEAPVLRMSLG
mmetsp:Transcript_9265/g.23873  ORF Transcript_9265/g.23873 Transcript_9265/m.23873 type:complete len:234 (+) Transcript_9265:62-763(+)